MFGKGGSFINMRTRDWVLQVGRQTLRQNSHSKSWRLQVFCKRWKGWKSLVCHVSFWKAIPRRWQSPTFCLPDQIRCRYWQWGTISEMLMQALLTILSLVPIKVHVGTTPQDQRIVGYVSCTHLQALPGKFTLIHPLYHTLLSHTLQYMWY